MADDPKAPLDSKKVEQVKKFINLAASSNLQEAKNAAYKACQLIRQLGLDIVDPEEINKVFVELADTQKQVKQLAAGERPRRTPVVDADDDFITAQIFGVAQAPVKAGDPVYVRPNPATHRFDPTRSNPATRPSDIFNDLNDAVTAAKRGGDPMTAPVVITTQYDQQPCLTCRRKVGRGERAYWMSGTGIWCPPPAKCYAQWVTQKQPRPFTGDLSDLFTK